MTLPCCCVTAHDDMAKEVAEEKVGLETVPYTNGTVSANEKDAAPTKEAAATREKDAAPTEEVAAAKKDAVPQDVRQISTTAPAECPTEPKKLQPEPEKPTNIVLTLEANDPKSEKACELTSAKPPQDAHTGEKDVLSLQKEIGELDGVQPSCPPNLQDMCMIILGEGAHVEKLARRRLEAGGRLLIVQTRPTDYVNVQSSAIVWHPPPAGRPITSLGKALGDQPCRYWVKRGPDVVSLLDGEKLEVLVDQGLMRGIRVSLNGKEVFEVSGRVIIEPTADQARDTDVTVQDEEAKAHGVFNFMGLITGCLWCTCHLLAGLTFGSMMQKNAGSDDSPWWWPVAVGIVVFPMFLSSANIFNPANTGYHSPLWLKFVGCIFGITGAPIMSISIAYPIGKYSLSMFCVNCVVVNMMVPFSAAISWFTTRHLPSSKNRSKLGHFKWGFVNFNATFGNWVANFFIGFVYVVLLSSEWRIVASVFLPLATGFNELSFVSLSTRLYRRLVYLPRQRGDPNAPIGDQHFIVTPSSIWCAHGFAEGTRLAAMFAGCIHSGEFAPAAASVAMSVVMNALARTGWARSITTRVMTRVIGRSRAVHFCAATPRTKLHDEYKFHLGYPRFVSLLVLGLSRLLVWQDFSLDGHHAPWFSQAALLILVIAFVGELLEDFVVHNELLPYAPVEADVLEHFQDYHSTDPAMAAIPYVHLGQYPEHRTSLALHGLRTSTVFQQAGTIAIVITFVIWLLDLLLGFGYVRGFCPEPLEGKLAISQAFIWTNPIECA